MPRGFPLQDEGPGMKQMFNDLAVEQEIETETDAERKVRWDRQNPVLALMLASSCFGQEVCKFPPCACAQSLIDAIDRSDKMRDALKKIESMFEEANFGSTLLKPNYGYYDVLKVARHGLKE